MDDTEPRSPRPRGGIRVRVTAIAVIVLGAALAVTALTIVAFVDRSLTAQVADEAVVRAQQIADAGLADGRSLVVADPEEEFVQVLDGTTVVASSANVTGLPPLADPRPEQAVRITVPTEPGPFIVVSEVSSADGPPRTVLVGLNIDDVVEARTVVATALLIGGPLLLAIVGLVTWWLVGKTLRPVEQMRAEVERISSAHLDLRVPTPRHEDEIGRLAWTMNRMLGRLEAGQERQRRFVSDASHELRSPVSAIRQHAEIAQTHPESTDLEALAQVVLAESARLQHLLEDLLVLARLDEHVDPSSFDEVDLDDVVLAEAVRLRDTTSVQIDTRGISAGRVMGNHTDLERVVRNLTENAVRHARGSVSVDVSTSDGEVTLVVDDDGPGIDPQDRARVLERFVRLDGSRDHRTGGSGLGLPIVQEIVTAHAGMLVLDVSASGGLRVAVRLPAAR